MHLHRAIVASPVLRYIKISYRLLNTFMKNEENVVPIMNNFLETIELIQTS